MNADLFTIGARLKAERERIGLAQTAFAALADAGKRTQIDWEKGVSSPTAAQLARFAASGVDVLYVITGVYAGGVKPAPTITAEEEALLTLFRAAQPAVRGAAIGALMGAPSGGMTQTQYGSGTQLGHVTGDVNIGSRKLKN
ncbi:transcriptional regulator [Ottowia oryzae]|uniref:Transcriptional regulator n=2 Tax=Ottowia oryzae TaxID=2109914 RepID=A0A2S0MAU2_9BURK|nr:transcriptional regulator [Ottowia oryzae]